MPRITVDYDLCQAQGLCSRIAPEVFGHDDDGYVVVINESVDEANRHAVEEAILSCPTEALRIEDQ